VSEVIDLRVARPAIEAELVVVIELPVGRAPEV
jgi:hypothetical protein